MQARRRRLATLALCAALAACNWGTRPENFVPALNPNGASVAVRVRGEASDRVGELYAADSVGVTIAAAGRVVLVPWARLGAMDVDRLGDSYDVLHGETVSAAKAERLALVSRFPQGLTGEVLARVLGAHGQAEVERVP